MLVFVNGDSHPAVRARGDRDVLSGVLQHATRAASSSLGLVSQPQSQPQSRLQFTQWIVSPADAGGTAEGHARAHGVPPRCMSCSSACFGQTTCRATR